MKIIKGIVKIFLIVVSILILSGIVLAIFFPTELIKNEFVKIAKKELGRDVTVEKVKFNILKGIIIRDVKVSKRPDFTSGEFIKCKAFIFDYDLFKLLQRKIVIRKLVLDQPEIFVDRYKSMGKVVYNFSDLMDSSLESDGNKPKPQPAKPAAGSTSSDTTGDTASDNSSINKEDLPVDINISELGLKNARVQVTDTTISFFKTVYDIDNIHFLLSDIGIKENKKMGVDAGLNLHVREWKRGKQTDKDIKLDFGADGGLTLFNDKGDIDLKGVFDVGMNEGKVTGLRIYSELVKQARSITGDASKYQGTLRENYLKVENKLSGKLKGTGKVIKKVSEADLGFIEKGLTWDFLQDRLEFDDLKTDVKVEDEKIITENIDMNGKRLSAKGRGYMGFDSTVNYDLRIIASRKYENEYLDFLKNKDGQIELPVKITGTSSEPKVEMSRERIIEKIKGKLKEKFENLARDKMGDMAKQYLPGIIGEKAGDLITKEGRREALKEVKGQVTEKVKEQAKEKVQDRAKEEAKKQAAPVKDKVKDKIKDKFPGF